jgi:methyl coenzyme M reductase subunit D
MAIHDSLPQGIQDSVDHHIRKLERSAIPLKDGLATMRIMAPALLIGLENDINAVDKLVEKIKDRWGYYVARGAWAADEEVTDHMNRLPRASSAVSNTKSE